MKIGASFHRALVMLAFAFLIGAPAHAAPETIELKSNWALASARQAPDGGETLSQAG